MLKQLLIAFLFTFLLQSARSQSATNTESRINTMKNDIGILASDSLKGREAGTSDEIMARDFIVGRLKEIGYKPYYQGTDFYKSFEFYGAVNYSKGLKLVVDGKKLKPDVDFYPMSNSNSGSIKSHEIVDVGHGITSISQSYDDYKDLKNLEGKIFLIEISVPGGSQNISKFGEDAEIDSKIQNAIKHGAAAIIFRNSDQTFDNPRNFISNNRAESKVPVLFVKNNQLINSWNGKKVSLNVIMEKTKLKAFNVAGFKNNGAKKTLVIGAHYDHLGFGGETSRHTGGKAIHNGADDNASGVAAILDLSAQLFNKELNYNILVVAFSAEEKGLYGSNFFVKNDINNDDIIAMLNFDMVGRLSNDTKNLSLLGTGSSVEWDTIIGSSAKGNLNITRIKSGIGGSDQMPFYLDSIPVLFFFTGIHADYHLPSDDIDKINFEGMIVILDFAEDLTSKLNSYEKLNYVKTANESQGNRGHRSGVSLGLVPGYDDSVTGLKVEDVVDGKPAKAGGVMRNDIIIKVEEMDIKSIGDYMAALKTLKKGQLVNIIVIRDGKEMPLKIQL